MFLYFAVAAGIAAYAAHDSASKLLLMSLLFCWMVYKRTPFLYLCYTAMFLVAAYGLMEAQRDTEMLDTGNYEGRLHFSEYTLDGDRLRGFAKTAAGDSVYASWRIPSADEKERVEEMASFVMTVRGQFSAPRKPAHDYAFDMERYIERKGASGFLTVEQLLAIEPATGMAARFAARRQKLIAHIDATFPPSLNAEAKALLLGERSGFTEQQLRMQRTLGITHLFAISGLHVGIITGLIYFFLLRIGVRKESAARFLIAALPSYALLAGAAPSVMRACAMAVFVLAAGLMRMGVSAVQALAASFMLFLLKDPGLLFDIGFQLSYGATFGIIVSLKLLEGASFFKAGLIVTAVSQLCLYPLLLFHFYEISLSSFIVNSFFVPLFTLFILPANFLLFALSALPGNAADVVFAFYGPLRSWISDMTGYMAKVPYQMWVPGRPQGIWPWVMAVSVLMFFVQSEKHFRLRSVGLLLVPMLLFAAKPYVDPALHVSFIDVGQGDSVLIELPFRRAVYLIDAGGVLRFGEEGYRKTDRPFEVGRDIVVPYLKGRGISSVDLLVLSHPDADHAEGADEVFEELAIERLHITPGSAHDPLMVSLAPFAQEAAVAMPRKGVSWSVGGTNFIYLSPEEDEYEGNDDSLVLLMEHQGVRFLFTGDLEREGEQKVARHYGRELEGLNVLKVGHHGSKTSSSQLFLETLQPKLSVVSAGIDNRYGHPSEEVTARFESLGLPLISTAEYGTIRLSVKRGELYGEFSRK